MSSLLSLNRFFVKQKVKIIEMVGEFAILDEEGNQVGSVRQEGQSKLKKALRFVSSVDQFLTHQFSVYDATGAKTLGLVRPAKFMKSKINVTDGAGQPVGTIEQQNVIGKIRFGLLGVSGQQIGGINAENWRAWNFSITDAGGVEIGRITKKWEGLAKTLFTTADNYMVEIDPTVQGPLRLMALAAAIGVDTALKQDSRGLS